MKQKLVEFKTKIRKEQLQSFFSKQRTQVHNANTNQSKMSQQINIFHQYRRNQINYNQETQPSMIHQQEIQSNIIKQKWDIWDRELKQIAQQCNYEQYLRILTQIYHSLKKVAFHKDKVLVDQFFNKYILVNVVDIFVHLPFEKLNSGLWQNISIKTIEVLQQCINSKPQTFTQDIFLKSNILRCLAYALQQPKYDSDHLTKILIILVHTLLASELCSSIQNQKNLFEILNNRNSPFHYAAIFYNIKNIEMHPNQLLTVNFIIFMKYYLLKVQQYSQSLAKAEDASQCHSQKVKQARQITIFNKEEIKMILQVSINSVNKLSKIDFEDQEEVNCLEEALQVLRISVQFFQMHYRHLWMINFNNLLQILSIKNSPVQIKQKVLVIIDHLIYSDVSGSFTKHLVQECELISRLWGLLKQHFNYVMNIFCNLALQKLIRKELKQKAHNIFLALYYEKQTKFLFQFAHNWFKIQDYQIRQSIDNLIFQQLILNSQSTNQQVVEQEYLLYYKLIQNNQLQVPHKLIAMDNQWAKKIKQFLNVQEESI